MSMQHYRRAREVRGLSPVERLVLYCLADHADTEGRSWPSIDVICETQEVGRSSVFAALRVLKARKLIHEDWTPGKPGCVCFAPSSPMSGVQSPESRVQSPDIGQNSPVSGLAYKEYDPLNEPLMKGESPARTDPPAHATQAAGQLPAIAQESAEAAAVLERLSADSGGKLRMGLTGSAPALPDELHKFLVVYRRMKPDPEHLRRMGAALKSGMFWRTKDARSITVGNLCARDGAAWLELMQVSTPVRGGPELSLKTGTDHEDLHRRTQEMGF